MEKKPYPWLARLEAAVYESDEIPLLASRSVFDFAEFSSILEEKLETKGLKVKAQKTEWLEPDKFHDGIGENTDFIPFTVSPISGEAFWLMNPEDISKLTSWMLIKDEKHEGFSSEVLEEGFYHYLVLECLDSLQKSPLFEKLSSKMNMHTQLPEKEALAIDIQITYKRKSAWGRLLLSKEFRKSWQEHFHRLIPHPFEMEIARKTDLTLGLKVGDVSLDQKSLKNLSSGDFVILDHASYDARSHEGTGILTLGKTPLVQMSIRGRTCEILEEAIFQEGNTMENNEHPNDEYNELPPPDSYQEPAEIPPPNDHGEEKVEAAEESSISFKNIPLTVTIEMARLKMSLDKLMKLEPGNTLELPIDPNEAVTLTVNGNKIGRAELVYLGETLGIRILEIGK